MFSMFRGFKSLGEVVKKALVAKYLVGRDRKEAGGLEAGREGPVKAPGVEMEAEA
jgi:hypothetical protein